VRHFSFFSSIMLNFQWLQQGILTDFRQGKTDKPLLSAHTSRSAITAMAATSLLIA
jgi:hypothetical protein